MDKAFPGITPAHAGTSPRPKYLQKLVKDHPRTRGDKRSGTLTLDTGAGSPPHTRGQVFAALSAYRRQRITPAHAGTSLVKLIHRTRLADHPRTRGDKYGGHLDMPRSQGSPPHTRGQALYVGFSPAAGGITPAHAGTSDSRQWNHSVPKDHPRTRGDKVINLGSGQQIQGSPPHTRGQADREKLPVDVRRITPAHAGTRM